tara:strand:+ start:1256 stop:1762 length:507 start_codon:yes stop_codon:yes gene_type:complete
MAKGPGEDASKDYEKNLKRLFDRVLPNVIANEAKEFFIGNFDSQSWDGKRWKEPGPGRERPGLPILEQSGDLRGNIEVIQANKKAVKVGTEGLPYAAIHNYGGRIRITPRSRRYFWAKHKETGLAFWRNMAMAKGPIKMPQRRFIGNSPKLDKIILQNIYKELSKLKM